MTEQGELFGKTFDQQVSIAGDKVAEQDISPNRQIPGEIVFEPLLNGVRVTARDSGHHVLWGFIGSQGMLKQIHCPVAVYETLQSLLNEELSKNGLPVKEAKEPIEEAKEPIEEAKNAIENLRKILTKLQESITVKKVSEATEKRANIITRIVNDSSRLISLEALSFMNINTFEKQNNNKKKKKKGDQDQEENLFVGIEL